MQSIRSALGVLVGWLRAIRPQPRHLRADVVAGLPGAISSVPDGMAAAVLAGVNPIQGLYASCVGRIAGGLTADTRLMVITTTSAAALAAGSALQGVPTAQRPDAVLLLAVLAGAALVAAGLAGLGRYTRFVSYSVLIGFLTGISVNIVCSQLSDFSGAPAAGPFPLAKAFDVITHPGRIVLASALTGLAALAILVLLARTRWATVSTLVALVIPTVTVALAGLHSVARVGDQGRIPSGIPLPRLPPLHLLSVSLVTGALAIAAIVLVQGAGVSEAVPNDSGAPARSSRDIIAQGAGNLAAGFFRGMPVGGSVSQTALNKTAGGRTRWAAIFSGVWMLVILGLFSGLVAKVAMPTLAAILVFAAAGSVRIGEIGTILRTGRISQVAVLTTFGCTLFLPVAAAVGIGIVLSLLLQLNKEALDLRVVELVVRDDGRFQELPAPATLTSHQVTVLDVYGSLLYAGSRTLQAKLPASAGTSESAVVLRLRGRTTLGATFVKVVTDYASSLAAVHGRLYLSGLEPRLAQQLRRTGSMDGPVRAFEATSIVGESTHTAHLAAEAWLVKSRATE